MCLPSGYNIPELAGNYLVLDCETLAAIYLNSITMWNDSRIKSINSPVVAALLPAQPIVVVTLSESSAITQLFTYMLNATVPSFAAQVPLLTQLINTLKEEDPVRAHGLPWQGRCWRVAPLPSLGRVQQVADSV